MLFMTAPSSLVLPAAAAAKTVPGSESASSAAPATAAAPAAPPAKANQAAAPPAKAKQAAKAANGKQAAKAAPAGKNARASQRASSDTTDPGKASAQQRPAMPEKDDSMLRANKKPRTGTANPMVPAAKAVSAKKPAGAIRTEQVSASAINGPTMPTRGESTVRQVKKSKFQPQTRCFFRCRLHLGVKQGQRRPRSWP